VSDGAGWHEGPAARFAQRGLWTECFIRSFGAGRRRANAFGLRPARQGPRASLASALRPIILRCEPTGPAVGRPDDRLREPRTMRLGRRPSRAAWRLLAQPERNAGEPSGSVTAARGPSFTPQCRAAVPATRQDIECIRIAPNRQSNSFAGYIRERNTAAALNVERGELLPKLASSDRSGAS
jgi:hypothetical protein